MTDTAAAAATASPVVPASGPARSAWHDHAGFGFRDILDIVNPLQHLPVIGSIYRWLTGDRPGEAAQIAGDALYGGPIGVAVSLAGAALEDKQGRDLGERALAALFGSGDQATSVADATPPASLAPIGVAPEAASATANALPASVVLDHPPMPLYRRGMQASAAESPAQAIRDHNAALQRQIAAGTVARSDPVPLIPPAGSLPAGRVSGPAAAPAAPPAPLDISQKMLDALDKYMRLEKERKAGEAAPSVDFAL
jgi:hypothetical protein